MTDVAVEASPILRVVFRDRPWDRYAHGVVGPYDLFVDHQTSPPPVGVPLEELVDEFRALHVLWAVAYDLAAYSEDLLVVSTWPGGTWRRAEPLEVKISRQSPMWVEFLGVVQAPASVAALTYALLRTFIKNPQGVGAMIPKIVESWHAGWSEAELAARRRVLTHLPREPRHAARGVSVGAFGALDYGPTPTWPAELQETRFRAVIAGQVLAGRIEDVDAGGPGSELEWTPPE